ncbi:MAG TPA: DUF983 domain-containing protein [Flavobacteriales bacterium]
MAWKETKLYSILHLKCPVCHEGDFFLAHPYNLGKAGELHGRCPACGCNYEKEIGFYTGAMYVSYAIGVAVCVSLWVAMVVLVPDLPIIAQLLVIGSVMLLGAPWFYALSKIIWANLFFRYDPARAGLAQRARALEHDTL